MWSAAARSTHSNGMSARQLADQLGRANPRKGRCDAQTCAAPQKDSDQNAPGQLGRRANRRPKSCFEPAAATKYGGTRDNAISHCDARDSKSYNITSVMLDSILLAFCGKPRMINSGSGKLHRLNKNRCLGLVDGIRPHRVSAAVQAPRDGYPASRASAGHFPV